MKSSLQLWQLKKNKLDQCLQLRMFEQDCEKVPFRIDHSLWIIHLFQSYPQNGTPSFVVTVQKNFSTNHDFYCRCLTGFTPTGRFSWPTMLTLVVTTVFLNIFLDSAIFLASDVIVDVYCIVYCLLHLCITRDCQQASRGTRTIHSGLQCKSSSHSKYLCYRIRIVQTIQYKTEIIQLEYI